VESPELLPQLAPVSVKQQWPEPPCRCAASGALRDALCAIFRGEREASPSLAKALSSSCSWSSALVDAKDRAGAAKTLKEFTGFVIDPVILFTDEQEESGGQIRLNWLLSFTYPTPWRPQVTVSGQSLLALNAERDKITNIVDEWDASPWTIIEQARPRLSDILWLYPAPHAETDLGTRKLLASHKGYKLVRVAARPEMRIESQLLRENEVDMVTAFPAIPPYAFNGGLRRRENYSTVSPIAVRHLGGVEYEYAIPIPGTIYGSSRATPLPVHPSEKVRIVMTSPRRCAAIRYGGFASSKIFEEKLKTLLANLERDGYVPAGFVVDRARVWARQYDSKIGFNGKSEVAIGTSGGSAYGIPPRWNELLVELPEYE
jgi:SOUL heme-binding protein